MPGSVGKPKTAELHPGPGFRIRNDIERPDPALVSALGGFDTPAISDLMNRLYTMTPEISNLTDPQLRLAGPACTVKVYPCLLYTSDAADDLTRVDLGGRRIIKK